MEYDESELTIDEKGAAVLIGNKINLINAMGKRQTFIIGLCLENMKLLKEVNEHRQARGFELKPVYDPKDMKIG